MKKQGILLFFILASGFNKSSATSPSLNKTHAITVLGTGYVGLITGACLADFGHTVICADTDQHKIDLLNHKIIPIYEPGLEELVTRNNQAHRITFTSNIDEAIKKADIIFIAVGTPMGADGCADLSTFKKAFSMIVPHLTSYKLICVKSTVPIGSSNALLKELQNTHIDPKMYDIVSNPEFLREGSAINDFMHPDRIIVGTESEPAQIIMKELYEPLLLANVPCFFTSILSAETIKYGSNAFLATKLSFVNELANLCDKTGADVLEVVYGMGLDKRIGPAFLRPGPGFGGSCFPKDCHALCVIADTRGVHLNLVRAALEVNENQKKKPAEKLLALMNGNIAGKTIAILGLAFKNNTDDIRYSPAITTIEILLQNGAQIIAYDPAAMPNMRMLFPNITYTSSAYEAATNADGLIIMTEWEEFKALDLAKLAQLMKSPILVDSRNLLDPTELQRYNFVYAMMGRP